MAILIDAEQLSKHKYVGVEYDRIDMGIPASAVNVLAYKWGWNDALDSVMKFAPTVEVVAKFATTTEVVRCKDCRHWIKDEKICCGQTTVGEDESSVITGENDFCSMGERW